MKARSSVLLLGGEGEGFLTGHGTLRGDGSELGAGGGPGDLGGGRSHELGSEAGGRHLDDFGFGGEKNSTTRRGSNTRRSHTHKEK